MGKSVREIQQAVYDGNANANNTSLVKSTVTLHAVVNTGAAGVGESLVTVLNPVEIAGNVTIDSGTITAVTDITNPVALKGNITIDSQTAWADPNTYIGLATIDIGSAPTLIVDATGQGDVPITLGGEVVDASGATIFAVVNTAAGGGNVTVEQGTSPWVTSFSGNITIDSGVITTVTAVTDITNPIATKGNVTIDSGVITTVTAVTDVTNPIALKGNLTIDQVDTVVALTDITNPIALKGNLTIDQVDVVVAVTDITNPIAIKGNLTIDSTQGYSVAYTSGPTTDWIIKGSAGYLHAIQFGSAVASSIVEISDHATDGDAAIEFKYSGDTLGPAIYPIGATMGTGITLDVAAQTDVTVLYR